MGALSTLTFLRTITEITVVPFYLKGHNIQMHFCVMWYHSFAKNFDPYIYNRRLLKKTNVCRNLSVAVLLFCYTHSLEETNAAPEDL